MHSATERRTQEDRTAVIPNEHGYSIRLGSDPDTRYLPPERSWRETLWERLKLGWLGERGIRLP